MNVRDIPSTCQVNGIADKINPIKEKTIIAGCSIFQETILVQSKRWTICGGGESVTTTRVVFLKLWN